MTTNDPIKADALVGTMTTLTPEELDALERAIDRMGWPEIHAFQDALRSGQDVYEDAGGYWIRCIKALFGIRRDPILTYQEAARAMVRASQENSRG